MKSKLFSLFLIMSSLVGCSGAVRLYPTEGPLSSQTPLPVLVGKLSGAFNSGHISVTLSDGEVCKGTWAVVPPPNNAKGANAEAAPTSMSSVWDSVYGPGFYVAHVLGAKLYVQAVVTGNRGTVFNVEMYRPLEGPEGNGVGAIKGVAKDNKDNVYKVVV
jgi:hypothetical protein